MYLHVRGWQKTRRCDTCRACKRGAAARGRSPAGGRGRRSQAGRGGSRSRPRRLRRTSVARGRGAGNSHARYRSKSSPMNTTKRRGFVIFLYPLPCHAED